MASHADIDKHVRTYVLIFVALMVLTLVTVGVSYLDLSVPLAIGLALFVALIKGSLVACFFMHLLDEKKLILVVMAFSVFFFIAVLILPVMTQNNTFGTEVGGADVAAQHESHGQESHGAVEGEAAGEEGH